MSTIVAFQPPNPQSEPSQFFWSSKSERSKKEGSMVKQKYSDEFKLKMLQGFK